MFTEDVATICLVAIAAAMITGAIAAAAVSSVFKRRDQVDDNNAVNIREANDIELGNIGIHNVDPV